MLLLTVPTGNSCVGMGLYPGDEEDNQKTAEESQDKYSHGCHHHHTHMPHLQLSLWVQDSTFHFLLGSGMLNI